MACACSSTSPDGSLEPPRDEAGRPLLAELTARPDAPQVAAGERGLRKHVWQCSLSLPADDRGPGDAEWRQVAERFIEGMGFAGDPERAGLRWVAVHHGLSSTGNDHVHLAVTLATEDGAPVWVRGDYRRAQQVADRLETEFGLIKRCQRDGATARRATTRGEVDRARRDGRPVTDREVLRREVRAAAAASSSETEWVRRMKAAGLLVAPRAADDDSESVVGYVVAAHPSKGKPVWFAGSTLDGDLSLPRIRSRWLARRTLPWGSGGRPFPQRHRRYPAWTGQRFGVPLRPLWRRSPASSPGCRRKPKSGG